MKALALIAHGSRREQSNIEVVMLAEKLKQKCSDHYPIICTGFLELAEPLIPDAIKQCIDAGATSIIVLPYFLNSGLHVIEDIPTIVNDIVRNYPDVHIKIAHHIGASPLMIDLLISTANAQE